jgi:hypothetical protein
MQRRLEDESILAVCEEGEGENKKGEAIYLYIRQISRHSSSVCFNCALQLCSSAKGLE